MCVITFYIDIIHNENSTKKKKSKECPAHNIYVRIYNVFIFIQRVLAAFTDDDKLTMAVHMLKTLEEDRPKYKTREMRRVFQKQINNLHSVNKPKHILWYMYGTLTGDNSA